MKTKKKHRSTDSVGMVARQIPLGTRILDKIDDVLQREDVIISLDKYQNMKGMIKDQKERIAELRLIQKPYLSVTFELKRNYERNSPEDEEIMRMLLGRDLPWLFVQVDVESASENEVLKPMFEALEEKFRVSKSFENSAYAMIKGIKAQKAELEAALERAPWWCRWAIKPKKDETDTDNKEST